MPRGQGSVTVDAKTSEPVVLVPSQNGQDLLHRFVVDYAPEARPARVLARNHHGHVVVKDLDGQVLALLTEDLLHLLLEDLPRPMVGVDDVIADVVLLLRRLTLEVLDCLLPL